MRHKAEEFQADGMCEQVAFHARNGCVCSNTVVAVINGRVILDVIALVLFCFDCYMVCFHVVSFVVRASMVLYSSTPNF